jgi:hypothetical protein
LAISAVQVGSQEKATFINKKGEIMDTQDGGKTWHIRNKPYQKYCIDNSKALIATNQPEQLIKKAVFIKNGVTKITDDGGMTWHLLTTEDSNNAPYKEQISLYPNPVTKDYVNIVLPKSEACKKVSVNIYNMTGTNVLNVELVQDGGSSAFAMNISSLPNGRYILKLVTEHEQYTTSMTVAR